MPAGSNAPAGYGAPGGYNSPPPFGGAGGQAAGGYQQNSYQPGQFSPGQDQQGQYFQGDYPQGQFQPGQYQQGGPGPYVQRSSPLGGLPPVNFDLARLTTVDKVVAGATLVTMISLWLPWFSATYLGKPSGSISGTGDHGWLWLEFILALALLAYFAARAAWDQLPFSLPLPEERLLLAATGLQFLLVLIGFFAMPSDDGIAGFSVSWDFGAFLALLGSLAAAGPVVYPVAKAFLDSRNAGGARRY